jgi:hypothetical protein
MRRNAEREADGGEDGLHARPERATPVDPLLWATWHFHWLLLGEILISLRRHSQQGLKAANER